MTCEGPECTNEIERTGNRGRPPRYCSELCKDRARRERDRVAAAVRAELEEEPATLVEEEELELDDDLFELPQRICINCNIRPVVVLGDLDCALCKVRIERINRRRNSRAAAV